MKTKAKQDIQEIQSHLQIEKLVPVLSKKEKQDIVAYYTVYEKYQDEFSKQATKDLENHSVFGKIIKDIPKEVSTANNKVSRDLQKDAIINDNWQPYIEYQIEQGVTYAKMGLDFKSWYEVIALLRNYLTPYLHKEYGSGDKFLSALNGMNNFMDIAMGIIGEAYMKEKKEIIKQANDYLASIFETTADVIFVLEVEKGGRYRFSSVNKAFQTTTGIPYEAVVGKYVNDIIPPPSLHLVLKKYKEAIEEKRIVRWEETCQYPTGWLTGEGSIAPLFDEAGNCIRLVGAIHDITERKHAEEILRNNEAKLKQAQKIARMGSWEIDFATNIGTWSEELCRIHGLLPEENKQSFESWLSFIHPEDLEYVKKEIEKSNASLSDTILNHRIMRKDGTVRNIYSISKFVLNQEGKPIGLYGISHDVTEQKIAEGEIKKLNEELEQKVMERTAQLQAVNNELEAFSYSISHDLRAPLRAINGFAKILHEDYAPKFDDEGMSSLNAIMNNSKRMGILIDDLLKFSRLGRKEISTSEINMTALVKSVKEEELAGNTNEIEFLIHTLPPVKGDQALIKQVWVNLISNAIKYSNHKPKTNIEIGSYYKDHEIVYFVKDNGVGFDMQYYNKLFGVFQRLHSQEEFEGTGVGLAIVQKIIHRHKGTIWAESKPNEGTSFYFSLPAGHEDFTIIKS